MSLNEKRRLVTKMERSGIPAAFRLSVRYSFRIYGLERSPLSRGRWQGTQNGLLFFQQSLDALAGEFDHCL